MDLIDQILQQARNYLFCPICNAQYQSGEVRFRGFIDNTYIFQAYCAKGHEPLAVTYLASLHKLEKPISAYFHTMTGNKITKEIADGANVYFDNFDGDFAKIFKD
jgi:hypothetical protein